MQDTLSKRTEQGALSKNEVERLSVLFAPDPFKFSGDRNRRRTRPNLYVETITFDEHGEEQIGWTAPRKVDAGSVLTAHFQAGRTQAPTAIPDSDCPPIRAVSLGYEEADELGWFSLDLDGGYEIDRIGLALAQALGKSRLACHSGSGRADRYRVFGLLAIPLPVARINELLRALCAHIGFPVKSKSLEVFPAYQHTRLPLGSGGCQRFDLTTGKPVGKPDQAKLGRAILALEPIDLEAEVAKLGAATSGIDTGIRCSRGRFDPYTRIERRRNTPRHIRREIAFGVPGEGHRNKHTRKVINDYLRKGYGLRKACESWNGYIDSGRMDASRFVKRFGREALKRQTEKTVRHIYATAQVYGLPDPIALSEREIELVKEIANRVPRSRYTSPYRAEKMLLALLPRFKSAMRAGFKKVRMHSNLWQAAGGTHYTRMRLAVGIFRSVGGYKSLASVRARKEFGAHECEAHAYSWECSFDFDAPSSSESLTYNEAIRNSIRSASESVEVVVDLPLPNTTVDRSTPSVVMVGAYPSSQPYVHHIGIEPKSDRSDLPCPPLDSQEPTILTATNTQADPAALPDARLPRRRLPINASKPPKATQTPSERPKVPEWRRLHNWTPKATADQSLDEFLDACHAAKDLVREYNRELSRAKRKQAAEGRRSALGRFVTDRFHELRAIFGLESWK